MIKAIDHIVITVNNMQESVIFYEKLGFTAIKTNDSYSLKAESFLIKLHPLNSKATPVAQNVQTGSVDICFRTDKSQNEIQNYLEMQGIKIELAKVPRQGFHGSMTSTYVRDPDGNLIELSTYENM